MKTLEERVIDLADRLDNCKGNLKHMEWILIARALEEQDRITRRDFTLWKWTSINDQLPKFNSSILGYCPIYGRCVRRYERINDTNSGQWDDPVTGNMGGLPPTHWIELPAAPVSHANISS